MELLDSILDKINDWRFERKFFIEGEPPSNLEMYLKTHPACFSEIYQQRGVNNIYLDTFPFKNYLDNVNGVSDRLKMRVRWYGHSKGDIQKPVLEIKVRKNQHIGKVSYALESFCLDDSFSLEQFHDVLDQSRIPAAVHLQAKSMQLAVMTCYKRKYFLTADGKFRVTLDSGMTAYRLFSQKNMLMNRHVDKQNCILELKYGLDQDERAGYITQNFPYRITKSSKYVDGMDRIFTFS